MATDWLFSLIKTLFYQGASGLLVMASKEGRLDVVEWLLKQGVSITDTDRQGRTALHVAPDRRMVRLLLDAQAPMEQRDRRGRTPLHEAVGSERLQAAVALTRAGAKADARTWRGITPLHIAAAKGRQRAVEHLLKQGANPNVLDRKGRHPLFYAVASGHFEASVALMKGGADLEVLDEQGTPWVALAHMDQVVALNSAADQVMAAQLEDSPWKGVFARVPFHVAVQSQGFQMGQ